MAKKEEQHDTVVRTRVTINDASCPFPIENVVRMRSYEGKHNPRYYIILDKRGTWGERFISIIVTDSIGTCHSQGTWRDYEHEAINFAEMICEMVMSDEPGEGITQEDWDALPSDYKSTVLGIKRVLRGSEHGTLLVPVHIV